MTFTPRKWYAFLSFLCLLPGIAQAQDLALKHYTVEDGLPSNTVYQVYRDRKGYLWLSTDKGVARFNGISFQSFTTSDGLADNEIFDILEDHQGRIWMSAFNGKLCYYEHGIFHTEDNTPWLYRRAKSMVADIMLEEDSSISLTFGNKSGLLNIKGDIVKEIRVDDQKVHTSGYTVALGKNNNNSYRLLDMWSNCIVEIDTLSNRLSRTYFSKNSNYMLVKSNQEKKQFLFHGNTLFSLDEQQIYSFRNLDTSVRQKALNIVRSRDDYFIATKTGLYLGNDFHLFKDEAINAIEEDLNGNYWIATYNKGIYSFYKNYNHTQAHYQVYKTKVWGGKLIDRQLFYVLEDGSLHKLVNGKDQCLFNPSLFFKNTPGGRSNETAYLEKNNYWYIGKENVVLLENIGAPSPRMSIRRKFYTYSLPKKIFIADKQLYFVYFSQIYTKTIQYLFSQKQKKTQWSLPSQFNHERIYSSAMDSGNVLWYATIDSMFKMPDPKTRLFQPQFGKSIFKDFVFLGDYLIGYTHGNVLYIIKDYASLHPTIDRIEEQHCIWEKMYKIDDNHLLIATNNHYRLLTFAPDGSKKYDIRTIENPYLPEHAEYVCADKDQVFFFKDGDITGIGVQELFMPTPQPRIYFTNIKAGEKIIPIRKGLQLNYDESREISLPFVPISYLSKDLTYEYSITTDTIDNNWLTIKGEVITLIKPHYGNYVIKLRVKSASSSFSEPAVITFSILRPFWAQAWFIGVCLFMLIFLIASLIRLFYRRKLQLKSKEHDADIKYQKSEYKALNALMNPHFIFNSLNNIQSLVNANDKNAANEYLIIFSDLVRQNMLNISEGIVSLFKELELVQNYLILEKLRFDDLINYSLDIDEEIDTEAVQIPPLLIQPLVENAIKHGLLPMQSPGSHVSVRVYEDAARVFVEIKDNGIGIEQSQTVKSNWLHQSYGLENLVKRIDHWNAINQQNIQFFIESSGQEQGTTALITIS